MVIILKLIIVLDLMEENIFWLIDSRIENTIVGNSSGVFNWDVFLMKTGSPGTKNLLHQCTHTVVKIRSQSLNKFA